MGFVCKNRTNLWGWLVEIFCGLVGNGFRWLDMGDVVNVLYGFNPIRDLYILMYVIFKPPILPMFYSFNPHANYCQILSIFVTVTGWIYYRFRLVGLVLTIIVTFGIYPHSVNSLTQGICSINSVGWGLFLGIGMFGTLCAMYICNGMNRTITNVVTNEYTVIGINPAVFDNIVRCLTTKQKTSKSIPSIMSLF